MKKIAIYGIMLLNLLNADEISSYKGDYYNDETFWGKIFVENPARCNDEKAGGDKKTP